MLRGPRPRRDDPAPCQAPGSAGRSCRSSNTVGADTGCRRGRGRVAAGQWSSGSRLRSRRDRRPGTVTRPGEPLAGGASYSGTSRRQVLEHLVGAVVRRPRRTARAGRARKPAAGSDRARHRDPRVVRSASRSSPAAEQLLVELLAGPQPGELELHVADVQQPREALAPGRRSGPARPCRARTSPCPSAIRAASSTRPTASSMVMKNRVTSGCVTVTADPRGELLADHVEQRAATAEHVAEPDRGQHGRRAWCAVEHHLGQPLGRTEDRGRVGRLVGRDQHEALDVVGDRGLDQVLGAARRSTSRPRRGAARGPAGA